MATFRKRGGKWQAQIRRLNHRPISRTFSNKRDAETWARQMEAKLERGERLDQTPELPELTLGDLLARYAREVSPTKRGAKFEQARIAKLRRHPLAKKSPFEVRAADVAGYRDARLQVAKGDTVRKELVLLRQVFDVARREWETPITPNPVDEVRKPPHGQARTRRVAETELKAICTALENTRNPVVRDVILFGLATGMRRGEILRVEWPHIDWPSSTLLIPHTKNGHARTIPLTSTAKEVLRDILSRGTKIDLVFPISTNAFRLSWERVRKRAGIEDLRFHDFRHEAVSRFFEAGLSLPEVALISGHRDPRQLMRYTHLEAAKIARKLASNSAI